ncbi:protein of uncharacterised function (DUF1707) [Mycobacteroides abscessus subsp. massiliense]|nr:protein of uncharacterised function (DUF1707) [Mycobacteroides abscessus subsp. massiliense]
MSNLPERVTASMRAADVDRMRVAQLLSDAAAQGRLELSEFEQRLAKVYSANTYGELDQLSADLPDVATSPVRGQGSKPAPSTVLMAIMSGFERRGRWNVPGKLTSFALWGGGVLDLRYADFTSKRLRSGPSPSWADRRFSCRPRSTSMSGAWPSWVASITRRAAMVYKAPRT